MAKLRFETAVHTETGAVVLRFRPDRPFKFTAGQHGLWGVPTGGLGPFSIASAPTDPVVEVASVLHDRNKLKRAMASLEPGTAVRFIGPLGHLAPPDDDRPVVALAQGIGITPIRSILRQPSQVNRALVHVGNHHFREETMAAAQRASYPDDREQFVQQLRRSVQEHADAHFLLAGAVLFVRETGVTLRALGVPRARIRRDPFYGAGENVGSRSAQPEAAS